MKKPSQKTEVFRCTSGKSSNGSLNLTCQAVNTREQANARSPSQKLVSGSHKGSSNTHSRGHSSRDSNDDCTELPQPPADVPVSLDGQNCICCFEHRPIEYEFESNSRNKPCQDYNEMCESFSAPLDYPPIVDPSKLTITPNPPLAIPLGQKIIFPPVVPNPLSVAGKTAVVIGASRGNGKAVAERLVAEGLNVIGTSRHPECYSTEFDYPLLKLDIRTECAVKAFFEKTVPHYFTRIDVLVNVAGVAWRGPLAEATGDDLLNSMNLLVAGYHRCAHYALPSMRHSNQTRIISFGSMAAYALTTYASGGYSISKLALQKWNDVMQIEELMKKAQNLVTLGPTFSLVEPFFVQTTIGLFEHFQASTLSPEDPLVRGAVFQQGIDQSVNPARPTSLVGEAIFRIVVAPQPGVRYAIIEPTEAPTVFPLIQLANTAPQDTLINISNTAVNKPRIDATLASQAVISAAFGCD